MVEKIAIKETKKGLGLFSNCRIGAEEVIFLFERNFVASPTNITLRIDEHLHQLSTDPTLPENFLNHSCEPNSYIDFENLSLRAHRDIERGEEITYDYCTSDWDGEDTFECMCASSTCKKYIAGFKNLSSLEKQVIIRFASPFLKRNYVQ